MLLIHHNLNYFQKHMLTFTDIYSRGINGNICLLRCSVPCCDWTQQTKNISGIHSVKQWELTWCQQHQTMSTELLVKREGRLFHLGFFFLSKTNFQSESAKHENEYWIMQAHYSDSAGLFPDENSTRCHFAEWLPECVCGVLEVLLLCFDGQVLGDPLQPEHCALRLRCMMLLCFHCTWKMSFHLCARV